MNKFVLALSAIFVGQAALASGYEKSIPFGGRAAGTAGIATPYMQGSEALFYNPAGLNGDKAGQQDVSFNLSPTQAKFKGPQGVASTSAIESKDRMVFPFGLMYGNSLTDKLGIGAGVYIAGGTSVEYTAAAPVAGQTIKSDMTMMEFALGAGYKVMDNLKLGASWRLGMTEAKLSTPGAPQTDWDGKASNFMGFKLGAQYKLSDKMNLGFTYRSEMIYKLKGTTSAGADRSIATTFPAAWTLGFSHQCTDTWKWMAEYVFTEYSKVDNWAVETNGVGAVQLMRWKDQTNIRLGTEYTGFAVPIRAGYIWTSQVTNSDYHNVTSTPPGTGNTFTLGTGYAMNGINLDGAVEYTVVEGTSTGASVKSELNQIALHLGAQYTF